MIRTPLVLKHNPLYPVRLFLIELGSIMRFVKAALLSVFLPPYKKSITLRQMDSIGVGSLPIVTLTGLFMGLVLALQSIVELRTFGATAYIGRPVGTTVVRELGPVLSAMMVAARAGSSIAAELGSMSISEQIDALRAEGSDPVKKLVEPRLLACTFMMPVLTAVCVGIAFCGSWIVACRDAKISSVFYWNSVLEVLTPAFIWGGLIKSLSFGFIIGIIACYAGIHTSSEASGVGAATTRAVVLSSILILGLDFLLTKIFTITWW